MTYLNEKRGGELKYPSLVQSGIGVILMGIAYFGQALGWTVSMGGKRVREHNGEGQIVTVIISDR